jgi:hypothetical protein
MEKPNMCDNNTYISDPNQTVNFRQILFLMCQHTCTIVWSNQPLSYMQLFMCFSYKKKDRKKAESIAIIAANL